MVGRSSLSRLNKSLSADNHDSTAGSVASSSSGGAVASVAKSLSSEALTKLILGGNGSAPEEVRSESDSANESKEVEMSDSLHESLEQQELIQNPNQQQHQGLLFHSVNESILEERESELRRESDLSPISVGGLQNKSIFRDSSKVSGSESGAKSPNYAKGVTFDETVMEYNDNNEATEESRQSSSTKLPPNLTQWDVLENNIDDDEDIRNSFSQQQQKPPQPGLLAKLNPFGYLSWSIIGSCIVRTAPCFWCAKKKLGVSATDREILLRLNVLCAFFCVVQIIMGSVLLIIKFTSEFNSEEQTKRSDVVEEPDEDKPFISFDLWSLELFVLLLSVINLALLIASLLAQRAIRDVNLVGSVRFMWVLFWLLPLQIFCMVGLFDTYNVNGVTIKHWWDDPLMAFIREMFCDEGTAHGKCKVPILGGESYENEEDWCKAEYNATDCELIRDDAQKQSAIISGLIFTANGIWALMIVVLMWVTLCVLQAIITLPIVQRSKESNIPLWLMVPIIGCTMLGAFLLFDGTSVAEEYKDFMWIAIAYLVSGGLFFLAALLGILLKFYSVLNSRQRRIKQGIVILFMLTILLTVFSVTTICVTSLIYTLNIVGLSEVFFRDIACAIDLRGSCTGCGQEEIPPLNPICPEWTDEDVQHVLQTVMKQIATFAAICLVYAMITLRYGFVLFQYVSRYQIEYV